MAFGKCYWKIIQKFRASNKREKTTTRYKQGRRLLKSCGRGVSSVACQTAAVSSSCCLDSCGSFGMSLSRSSLVLGQLIKWLDSCNSWLPQTWPVCASWLGQLIAVPIGMLIRPETVPCAEQGNCTAAAATHATCCTCQLWHAWGLDQHDLTYINIIRGVR